MNSFESKIFFKILVEEIVRLKKLNIREDDYKKGFENLIKTAHLDAVSPWVNLLALVKNSASSELALERLAAIANTNSEQVIDVDKLLGREKSPKEKLQDM